MKHSSQKLLMEHSLKEESGYKRLLNHLIYKIATGKWVEGTKLPSVREAERKWGVERRTVLRAYQRLEEMSLVEGVNRSGYYVTTGDTLDRVKLHRFELDSMFNTISSEITSSTGLSPLGVFRYFSNLAEIKTREAPECAYVECSVSQATGHAREIEQRLGVPCAALIVDQIADRPDRIPPSVKCLITNPFHATRLRSFERSDSLSLTSVPIQLSPDIALNERKLSKVLVIEKNEREAENIANDLQVIFPEAKITWRTSDNPDDILKDVMSGRFDQDSSMVFVSPRLWGLVDLEWREKPTVREATFKITDSAWTRIADAIGLPLGALAVGP